MSRTLPGTDDRGTGGSPDTGSSPETADPRRSGRVRLIRIAAAVLGGALVTSGTLTVVTGFATRHRQQTFEVAEQITRLKVTDLYGDVTVTGGPADEPVRVEVEQGSTGRNARHTWSVSDSTLNLTGQCLGGWPFGHCSLDLRIVVPAGTALQVVTGAGDQSVSGIDAKVQLASDSGDLRLTGLRGAVNARTDSGTVRVRDSVSESATLESDSGDLDAEISGDIRLGAATDSGDVRLRLGTAPVAVDVLTDSGDVQILVPDDGSRYLATGRSETGQQQIDVPTGGSDHQISVRTDSGRIRVETD